MKNQKAKKLFGALTVATVASLAALTPTAAHAESSFPFGQQICPPAENVVVSINYSNASANGYVFYSDNQSTWHTTLQHVIWNGVYHYYTGLNPLWGGVRYTGNLTWGKSCTNVSLP